MIEIQLGEEVIELKEDITIGMYQKIKSGGEELTKNPAKLLSIYLNKPLALLKDASKEDVQFVEQYLSSILAVTEVSDELHNYFTLDGVTYGLENDWTKLQWGAWVDLEVYSSGDVDENIHKIMSILYRPILEWKNNKYIIAPYKSDEIEDRAELFREKLPVKYWWGAANFFFLISVMFMRDMQNSLNTKIKINNWIVKGWEKLPKFLQRRIPLDSILLSHITSQKKTLQKFNK
jgi:hypothetical protein